MAESKVAIVTGGAQGLGAAITVTLLEKCYRVCVADIQEEKGKQFVNEQQKRFLSHSVKFIASDVTKEDDYKGIFEFALKEFGRLDLVINNAGIMLEGNERKVVDVNLIGPIIGCRLALKYMGKSNGGKGGMVINTCSLAGLVPFHAIPVYAATKHGVLGLTRSYGLPYHLQKDGVIFAALCPYLTNTEMRKDLLTKTLVDGNKPFDDEDVMAPEYVAQGVLKLLEDRINGSALVVTKREGYTYVGYPEEIKKIVSKLEEEQHPINE